MFEHPPSGFSQIADKRRRGALPFLAQQFIHLFRTLCENLGLENLRLFENLGLDVTYSVPSSDLTSDKLNARYSYPERPITLKLSAIYRYIFSGISVPVSMKRFSQNFDIGDLRSGQFCDLSIISQ